MPKTYPPDLEQFVRQELANGSYLSEDELLIDALTAFREVKERRQELRRKVQHALAQAERGELAQLDIDVMKAELENEFDDRGRPY